MVEEGQNEVELNDIDQNIEDLRELLEAEDDSAEISQHIEEDVKMSEEQESEEQEEEKEDMEIDEPSSVAPQNNQKGIGKRVEEEIELMLKERQVDST